ncbi:hypothetical protein COCSUDRAFT_67709 [Coccomyxa subellipsoidea C-169]|uniref:Uncharacterized protein n=1 Tax=Coccomyxa subellipsoidea (strain C-169) TaxID=574566 RepID=I0YMG7_COCSC|nr:hypothetical protein COCSUDRAFT_67709 [Coccomyxa subellipsoidea C-169]EIE19586.1 hypothetical protein COCSUDRAFT_67709 [Coccomyxa subellipsoidea C-169]|eukprot:XP_005644130.1 hypothetical protein COCSUDRAFT_67709 [Coccomyxa subellipsoidea C-169]
MEGLGDYGDTDSEEEHPSTIESPPSKSSAVSPTAPPYRAAPTVPQPGTLKLPSAADLLSGKGLDRAGPP